jgi:hypothetical protein
MSATLKQWFASVCCFPWQNRLLLVGEYMGVCWKSCRTIYEAQYELKHHNCSPPSFPLILESNKNSSLHHLRSIVYILYKIHVFDWSVWFCHQQLCELPVHGVLNVAIWRLYSDHRETQLYLLLATSRKWQWGDAAVLGSCHPPCLMYADLWIKLCFRGMWT